MMKNENTMKPGTNETAMFNSRTGEVFIHAIGCQMLNRTGGKVWTLIEDWEGEEIEEREIPVKRCKCTKAK